MALPQSVDPTTLNISGKPALSTVAPTTTTSAGATGMPMPTIAMEKNEVPLGAGALLGYALGNLMGNRGTTALTGTPTGNAPTGGTPTGNKPSGNTPTGGTPTGNIGSVQNVIVPSSVPISEAQAWLNQNYGTTNGQPNYVVSGTNLSTGEVIGLPNDQIGGANLGTNTGNFGFEAGTGTGGTTTGGTTQIGNQYFQDSSGNVYDADGTLIYYNPSNVISGGTMDGGGYDPNAEEDVGQFFQSDAGDIYDYAGNLVLEYGNGYYYEPDTGNYYDSNFDVVGDDFSFFEDFMGLPAFDSSMYGDLGDYFDYGNYTSGSTTYIKDGGSVRGGLATPLFKKGGQVRGYADGNLVTATPTSFTDQVVANQMPQSTSTQTPLTTTSTLTNPTTTTSSRSGVVNTISNLLGNSGVSGALLGTLIAQLLNSTEQPVNKGVDMTALGRLAPRTTPTGPARFVPYSEYGTPTTSYDYSQLYANLGVSPFGAGTGALSPSATPTTPVSAQPTTPTGGLSTAPSTISPTGTVTTPPTTTTPQYFQDADGNIYDANGNLVYDTTSGTTTASAQQTIAPSGTTQASVAPMSGLAVTTPEATSSYYSYGSDVNPSQVLSSKKGGAIRKFADGGLSDLAVTSLSDTVSSPVFDYSDRVFSPMGGVKYDATTGLATDVNGNTMDVSDFVGTYGTHPSNFTPDFYGSASPSTLDPKELYSILSKYPSMEYMADPTWQAGENSYSNALSLDPTQIGFADKTLLQTEPDLAKFYPQYVSGMPEQRRDLMPTQGTAMPTQGALMPQQGSLMPSQTLFSTSPTFRYSGLNNPLLSGLSMNPTQPYMLAEGGSPHGNPNVPMSENHNPNVPVVQGRQDYRQGAYVQGAGDGQSDDIPAMLADGEYVIDAETVAQLGNGSNKAGAKMLDEFRKNIRAHKRSAPTHKIPPKSKSPLAYLKGAK